MGLNLEVPLEMVDAGFTSSSGSASIVNQPATSISLNPNDYDGATYYFEVVGSRPATENQAVNVYLRNSSGTIITLPLVKDGNITRYRSGAFTPTSGNNVYYLGIDKHATAALTVYTARIIIVQTNATKTRLQFHLVSNPFNQTISGATNNGTTYGMGLPQYHALWKKENNKLKDLVSGNAWAFESVIKNIFSSDTGYASLFNATDNTQVLDSELSYLGSAFQFVSKLFSDSATNFHNNDEFEVRMKSSNTNGGTTITNAFVYVYLTNLKNVQIHYRTGRCENSLNVAVSMVHQRAMLNQNNYTNPQFYYEMTSGSAVATSKAYLYIHGTNDYGTTSPTDLTDAHLSTNITTKVRIRSAILNLTEFVNGNRFYTYIPAFTSNSAQIQSTVIIEIQTVLYGTGSLNTISSLSTNVKNQKKVIGSISTVSSILSNVKKKINVISSLNSVSSVLSNVKNQKKITGTFNNYSSVTGLIKKIIKVTSNINTNSGLIISFHDVLRVIGVINNISVLNADIKKIQRITGNITNTSTISFSNIKKILRVIGNINSPSFLLSNIQKGIKVSARINEVSNLGSKVQKLIKVTSIIDDNSFLTGLAFVYKYIELIEVYFKIKKPKTVFTSVKPSTKINIKKPYTIVEIIKK